MTEKFKYGKILPSWMQLISDINLIHICLLLIMHAMIAETGLVHVNRHCHGIIYAVLHYFIIYLLSQFQ